MVWSYNTTQPGSSDLSYVRLRIGDTSSGSPLLQDEEIEALLDSEGNKEFAAAVAAETIGASLAIRTDKTVGKFRLANAKASESYFKLADRLRMRANIGVAPYVGGISQSDIDAREADADQVGAPFQLGMHDFPGSEASEGST